MASTADQGLAPDTPARKSKRLLLLRVLLLATLLFGLNAWSLRHLGIGHDEFVWLNSFAAFVGIVLGWIGSRDAGKVRARLLRPLAHATDFPVLAFLYLAALVGTSFISSVTVVAGGRAADLTLNLVEEGAAPCSNCSGKSLSGPNAVVRFVRFTSVFGRLYYLEASGYQRKGFALYPWVGTTINMASDLVRLPTILLRVPPSLQASLAGSKLVIELESAEQPYEIPMQAGRASALLGPAASIPGSWRSEWRSELRALDVPHESLRERFFRNWLKPIKTEADLNLLPGQRVRIRFVTAAQKEVVNQEQVIGREPLQDIILIPKG